MRGLPIPAPRGVSLDETGQLAIRPATLAQVAADAKVPVYTIAFGTDHGVIDNPSGQAIRTGDTVQFISFAEWLA